MRFPDFSFIFHRSLGQTQTTHLVVLQLYVHRLDGKRDRVDGAGVLGE